MKKLLLASALILSLNAKIVDKVIASVNNIPITSYDLQTVINQTHLNKQQALNYLIDQKIIDSEIKKRGISVDDYEIAEAMSQIAKRNNMSLFEFKNILMQKGELKKFRNQIKQNLLKQKLFAQIVNSKLHITPQEIKNYYNTHKNEFTIFDTVQATEYMANNPEVLKNLFKNPFYNDKNIISKTVVLSSKNLPLDKIYLFKNTKVNSFTPIINDGLSYVTYYVVNKEGKRVLPFDEVKNIIANELINQKRNRILREYFNQVKNRADIKFYNWQLLFLISPSIFLNPLS